MKILIDARMYGLENTGIGRYLIGLIDELQKTKSDIRFVVLLRKKYFELLNFQENWEKVLADIPSYSLKEQILLPGIIKRAKPDLVHFPHINVPVLYKGKYVVTAHDLTMQRQGINASKLPAPLYLLKRIPFLKIAKKAVNNAEKIFVPSKSTATELANYYNISIQKIVVTYEGFYTGNLPDTNPAGEMSVLSKYGLINKEYFFYVGNAYPHKNLKMAIKAVKDIRENKNIDTIFLIAGLKDYFFQKLEAYIHDIGANEYIKLAGYVKDEDLHILYKYSLGFIYPSLSEGFGLQGLEAISMGTTLACSSIPVFKEIYEFHAFYFDPNDLSSISGALYSIYTMNKEDKHRYIRNAKNHIERYSWKKMVEETLNTYKGVLELH